MRVRISIDYQAALNPCSDEGFIYGEHYFMAIPPPIILEETPRMQNSKELMHRQGCTNNIVAIRDRVS